jgi:cysteine synthase B
LVSVPSVEPKRAESVLDLIGDTPLLEIRKLPEGLPAGVRIFAKLEGFNPGGSVKDRAALRMVQEGIRNGKLRPDKTILDSSSGNTGIALAMIGRVLGYSVELVVPENVSRERKQIIHAYGAKIVYSDRHSPVQRNPPRKPRSLLQAGSVLQSDESSGPL